MNSYVTSHAKRFILRSFQGVEDLQALVDLDIALKLADDDDGNVKLDSIDNARNWLNTAVSDSYNPYTDLVLAEIDGQVIGKGNVKWSVNESGEWIYAIGDGGVHPSWRKQRIGGSILKWQERRACEIAQSHRHDGARAWLVGDKRDSSGVQPLYGSAGYSKISHRHIMTINLRGAVPERPMPDGFEIRHIATEQMESVWNTAQSAFEKPLYFDAYRPMAEEAKAPIDQKWWHVAWTVDTNEVAGGIFSLVFPQDVVSDIDRCEIWTDFVAVREQYRRRGLGKGLLAHHLHEVRALGITDASLAVDDNNPHQAKSLYDELGYKTIASWLNYRKPLAS